jgi:hypothetical protein
MKITITYDVTPCGLVVTYVSEGLEVLSFSALKMVAEVSPKRL